MYLLWNVSKIFLNFKFNNWKANKEYKKDDVVFFEGGPNNSSNKLNNFFYCLKDHVSHVDILPSWDVGYGQWTQEFNWCPDANWQNSVNFDVTKFGSDFQQREKNRKNSSLFEIDYKFSAISSQQLKSMLHFLENKGGYRRFIHNIPSLYNRPKVVIAVQWTHTWVSCEAHDLSVRLIEDPLGVMPEEYEPPHIPSESYFRYLRDTIPDTYQG